MLQTDGIIELDSDSGRELGFTSERFGGYLWKTGNYITVSLIMSNKRGNFRELVECIQHRGYGVIIPTPLGRMEEIVRKNGYVQRWEDSDFGPVELWALEPRL